MTTLQAMFWALAGALTSEGFDVYRGIRGVADWSWKRSSGGKTQLIAAVAIRAGMGVALTGAAAASQQVTSPFVAFWMGITAPIILERLARTVPMVPGADAAMASDNSAGTVIDSGTARIIGNGASPEQGLVPAETPPEAPPETPPETPSETPPAISDERADDSAC